MKKPFKLGLITFTTLAILYGCKEEVSKEKDSEEPKTENVETDSSNKDKLKESSRNVESSIIQHLNNVSEKKETQVHNIIKDNFKSINGIYAYHAEVISIEKSSVELDLGLSTIRVQEKDLLAHEGFLDSVSEFSKGDEGLALVTYKDNKIQQVDLHILDEDGELVRSAIQKYVDTYTVKEKDKKAKEKEKTFKEATIDDWAGMTLLTARDILNRDMAPVFIVPTKDIKVKKDLKGTFYYIVAGQVISSSDGKTKLMVEDKVKVNADFDVAVKKDNLNKPSWIHIITKDGKVINTEIQSFDGADLDTMLMGVSSYIKRANYVE